MAYLNDLIAQNACCCDSYSQLRNWELCTNTQTANAYTLGSTHNYVLQYNDVSSLQDIINKYGNLHVQSLQMHQEFGSLTTFEIECTLTEMHNSITKKINTETKEENNEMENKFFNDLFGKLNNGVCRLSMDGEITVKTSNGYKYYNKKSNRPVNCDQFVFDIGDEFFFVVPTNKTEVGDILLINGQPRYVLETKNNMITVLNYEDCTVESILPESHVFMGDTYFYEKIVSMFGDDVKVGGVGMKKMMRYMMLSEMMKSFGSNSQTNAMANMMLLMMMSGGKMGDFFSGIFDFGDKDEMEHADGETDKRAEIKD